MSPPGKVCGVTTKVSVESAMRPVGGNAGDAGIVAGMQLGRVERLKEHLVDEALHHGSARPMSELNGFAR